MRIGITLLYVYLVMRSNDHAGILFSNAVTDWTSCFSAAAFPHFFERLVRVLRLEIIELVDHAQNGVAE